MRRDFPAHHYHLKLVKVGRRNGVTRYGWVPVKAKKTWWGTSLGWQYPYYTEPGMCRVLVKWKPTTALQVTKVKPVASRKVRMGTTWAFTLPWPEGGYWMQLWLRPQSDGTWTGMIHTWGRKKGSGPRREWAGHLGDATRPARHSIVTYNPATGRMLTISQGITREIFHFRVTLGPKVQLAVIAA